MRCIFWRDPSHRLSNLFINSLRGVPGLMTHVLDHLLVHTFRRAPYGSGRMFKECKETIALALNRLHSCTVLIEPLADSIANELRIEASVDAVVESLHGFLRMALGPRVEMRRWFTYMDMAPALDRMWHTLLFALIFMAVFEGKDPWVMAAAAAAAALLHRGGATAPKDEDEQARTFRYKSECLRILLSAVSQSVLRSIHFIFQRTRQHQAWVAKHGCVEGMSIKYLLFWSHPDTYKKVILLPSIKEALCNRSNLQHIGFIDNVPKTPSEASADLTTLQESQAQLRFHLQLLLELCHQWWVFELLPQSPPWCYVRALSPERAEAAAGLARMRDMFELFLRVEASTHTMVSELLSVLFFRDWPVVREPLELFAHHGWDIEARLPLEYIKEFVSDYVQTLMEECSFNDLRDDEARDARHKQRGEHALASKVLSCTATRYAHVNQSRIEESDVAQFKSVRCKAHTFHPEMLHGRKHALGVDSSSLLKPRSWVSTTFDQLAQHNMTLLMALLATDEAAWSTLWLSSLIARGVILASPDTDAFYYVVGVSTWLLFLWRLEQVADDVYTFVIDAGAFITSTVHDLDQFIIYEHDYSLQMRHDATIVLLHIGEACSILRMCVRCSIHKLQLKTLRRLRDLLHVPASKATTQGALVQLIVEFIGLDATEDGKRAIARAREREQNRAIARAAKRQANKDAGKAEDNSDSAASATDQELPETDAASLLRDLAPMELGFLMGKVPASMGLCEEEVDDTENLTDSARTKHASGRGRARGSTRSGGRGTGASGSGADRAARVESDSSTEDDHETTSRNLPHDDPPLPPPLTPPTSVHGVGLPFPANEGADVVADEEEGVVIPPTVQYDGLVDAAEPAAPPSVPDIVVDRAVASVFKIPGVGRLPAPAGCTFNGFHNCYAAKLPKGVRFSNTNSRTRNFGITRSKAVAYAEVKTWLDGAVAAGLVNW